MTWECLRGGWKGEDLTILTLITVDARLRLQIEGVKGVECNVEDDGVVVCCESGLV